MNFIAQGVRYLARGVAAAAATAVVVQPLLATDQTQTLSPVVVGGGLPYRVELREYDMSTATMPTLHSFVAGEIDHQWVIVGGLSNGLHGFNVTPGSVPTRHQNRDVWVIDPVSKQTWSRSLDPSNLASGLTEAQVLSLSGSSAQAEQLGDRLYMTGGYGDNDPLDVASQGTFAMLTEFNLSGLADWVKGGAGLASDHIRQVEDERFRVTGGAMYEMNNALHLVFGQDYEGRYRGRLNGEYTKQVRSFSVDPTGANLAFTPLGETTPLEHFRRRDLNVFPSLSKNPDGSLAEGLTVLSGVFTETDGAWTVPVEIDATGAPTQADRGNDPLNTDGSLDTDPRVFKQGMNNYHSAKAGLFSSTTGEMHELLFGGISMQVYDPTDPRADAQGIVTDTDLPNTYQASAVVRDSNGDYQQYYLTDFPNLQTPDGDRMRFGSNAEFFLAEGIETYANGVINLDSLSGETRLGYIYGGLIANLPHIFFTNPLGLSSASGYVFEVVLITVPEPSSGLLALLLLGLAPARGVRSPRPA